MNCKTLEWHTLADENSILNEIYNSTLRPDSEFGGAESTEEKRAFTAIDTLLEQSGVNAEVLEATQEMIITLEGIKHQEGFMSGFKYAMRLFNECARDNRKGLSK